jgi:hypothetical protein
METCQWRTSLCQYDHRPGLAPSVSVDGNALTHVDLTIANEILMQLLLLEARCVSHVLQFGTTYKEGQGPMIIDM